MRHQADVLDEVKETIVNAYQLKTKRSRNKISQLMDDESWMSAKTAISEGFADGMLYTEDKEAEPAAMNFSRLAIQNSCNDVMKHFLEVYKTKVEQSKPPEEPRQVPVDLYSKYENIIERRSRL
jgi:ATP-dependent Clp protease protease subunit